MSRRILPAVVALLVVGGGVLQASGPSQPPMWGAPGAVGLWAIAFSVVGWAIVRKQPGHPVGSRLLLAGLWSAATYVWVEMARDAGRLPVEAVNVAAVMASWSWAPATVALGLALLYFPDGKLPSRKWRFVEPALWAVVAVFVFATAFGPVDGRIIRANPLAWRDAAAYLAPLSINGWLLYVPLQLPLAACIAAPLARYRRASGLHRRQLRLVALAGALVAVTVLTAELAIARLAPGPSGGATWVTSLAVLLLPIAMGVAILRYRLYDIDRLISRTVAYALVTVALGLIYVGGVVLIGALLRPVTADSQWAVAASTLVVAAVFGPLRRKVQEAVDHRFNRASYDAARTVQTFSAGLRDETDLETLATQLQPVTARSVEPAHVSLWLRTPEGTSP